MSKTSSIRDVESGDLISHKDSRLGCIAGCIVSTVLGLFMIPFGVASIYYAYTDKSCVNMKAGNLYINLHDYLAVDGILLLTMYLALNAMICFVKPVDKPLNTNIVLTCVSAAIKLFSLSWQISGAIIFWNLIDNKKCDNGIYNYVYALLIIKFVFIAFDAKVALQNK